MVRKNTNYIPARGDIVWMNFSPQAGFEQAGRRPALVLTSKEYNRKTSRCIVCPITSQVKGYTFEYPLPTHCSVQGVVLTDHVKNQDWTERNVEFAATLSSNEVDPICDIVDALIRTN
ncbi:MAG: type II toxin-antitoxin system PemK/MazF family toxin [Burkholderiaceae bacterium]